MGLLILVGFVLWAWAEITVFIEIGGELGGLLTFLGVFVTAVFGLWLLKKQGAQVMLNLRAQISRGEAPLASLAESLSLLVGGILMLIPGYITDAVGLLMFVPGLRTIIGIALMNQLVRSARFRSFAQAGNQRRGRGGFDGGFGGGFGDGFSNTTSQKWPGEGRGEDRGDDTIIDGDAEERPVDPDELPHR